VALVGDGDGSGCGKTVLTGNSDGKADLGMAAEVVGFSVQRSLSGHALRGQGLRDGSSQRQDQHGQGESQSLKQLKPQTAAENASHVHLLQISRE
jgi:hypothetical protein